MSGVSRLLWIDVFVFFCCYLVKLCCPSYSRLRLHLLFLLLLCLLSPLLLPLLHPHRLPVHSLPLSSPFPSPFPSQQAISPSTSTFSTHPTSSSVCPNTSSHQSGRNAHQTEHAPNQTANSLKLTTEAVQFLAETRKSTTLHKSHNSCISRHIQSFRCIHWDTQLHIRLCPSTSPLLFLCLSSFRLSSTQLLSPSRCRSLLHCLFLSRCSACPDAASSFATEQTQRKQDEETEKQKEQLKAE